LILASFLAVLNPSRASADTNAEVAAQLSANDVYITNQKLPGGAVHAGDLKRLQAQANAASARNVDEKLAIVAGYPSNFKDISEAAVSLQSFLDYSGVLILVSPNGMGISSDLMSTKSMDRIIGRAQPVCRRSYADCTLLAGRLAIPAVRSAENSSFRDAIVLIAGALVGLAVIAAVLAYAIFRRRRLTVPIPT